MSTSRKYPDLDVPNKSLFSYVIDYIEKYGDKVAIIDNERGGETITFNEIIIQAKACTKFLQNEGLIRGDIACVCAPTCNEFLIAVLGITACGASAVLCNPAYTEGEILQQFRISEPKFAFVHESALVTMKKIQLSLPCLKKIYVIGKTRDEIPTYKDIMLISCDTFTHVDIDVDNDVAVLPYSSGTTGMPKSVQVTHKNVVASIEVTKTACSFSSNDTLYTDRPMYHALGYLMAFTSLVTGMTLVTETTLDVGKISKSVEKYKITKMLAGPPTMIELAESDFQSDMSSLTQLITGGAGVLQGTTLKLREKFNITLTQIYGSTETQCIARNKDSENYEASVGFPVSNQKIKIVAVNNRSQLPANTTGEILVKSPAVAKGYLKNPEASKQAFDSGGWFCTGDLGYIDEDGRIYIVGRLKEVIKYKTFQVPPLELESGIFEHSKVSDVGVIGIPDKLAGEIPKAFVVKKDDSLTEQEVIAFVQEKFVEYKHLRGGVEFVDKIPRSSLGKIQRRELKKLAGIEW